MPTYHIWTIGCQMNKAESERLGSFFEQKGYRETATAKDADLILVNSCVVRQSAENKVVNKLHAVRHLKKTNPDIILAVTGCFVDPDIPSLRKKFPFVDHFFPAGGEPDWLDTPENLPLPEKPGPAVYVPISQGCNNFCSYCIVPYRRGRERSRPMEIIAAEVKEVVARGAVEVTLLGQNVDSWGKDLPGAPDLADLLTELNGTEGLLRLRFLTNHPKDMSSRLIEAVAKLDKVCRQINLPVQAGDDEVLHAMRRGYTVEHYRGLITEAREKIPGLALSTDIIVGFPGESEEQFRNTRDLLEELRFDAVHVAAYSPRTGTYAARELEDDIPADEKKRRLDEIEVLQERIATEINARLLGETVEVLVEGRKKGRWQGRTRSDKLVFFTDDGNWRGKPVQVKIEKTSPWSLQGTRVD